MKARKKITVRRSVKSSSKPAVKKGVVKGKSKPVAVKRVVRRPKVLPKVSAKKAPVKRTLTTKEPVFATPREAKGALRKVLRTKIEALRGKATKSQALCDAIIQHPAWRKASCVAIFAPMEIEPNVELLWEHAQRKVMCYPLMRMGGLDFVSVNGPDSLVVGPWGVREPVMDQSRVIPPTEIDFMLIPGFGFCPDGRRLGRGGGFYDRLLATPGLRAWKLAAAFQCQVLKDLPSEPHDRRVHRIVTEKGFVAKPPDTRLRQKQG